MTRFDNTKFILKDEEVGYDETVYSFEEITRVFIKKMIARKLFGLPFLVVGCYGLLMFGIVFLKLIFSQTDIQFIYMLPMIGIFASVAIIGVLIIVLKKPTRNVILELKNGNVLRVYSTYDKREAIFTKESIEKRMRNL